ncbi:Hsp33 family molecular chaperone HslO [Herbinix luporum]|jgi:molecular chaperone Hsp33|uniref:33 kDa chaperonin n=1 Tax=Herbinix luporum TaxID=1679721 RepID=A0A0K8J7I0_9FIRM|nr:Hsp33 family molecular chaperone HslO [Herbinix luporum]MDI9487881.1 Hsp33 family molecular chaperone HslO [Bacillota bacterium]CUH93485.1 33 kDa chaperonin [Herbinix luporum]HHT56369.1 Hsp33 family molecular chaperone HslO [Herbinix luporum]
MTDYIVRASAANNQIRAFAATSKNLIEHARTIHNTSPIATAALGRLLTAGAMMGVMMKGDKDLLTLQIKGNGPIGGVTVTANSKGTVKGYVYNPQIMLPANPQGKLDVGGAIGEGMLTVIKDLGLKEPYVGQTNLVSGEIAEDLTYYYATSEQVPSSVALGVLMNKDNTVRCGGGFILQLMPFAEDEVISKLEEKISGLKGITGLLDKGMTPEMILDHLLGDLGMEILEKYPTGFECNCSKERVEKAVISIGKKDIKEMIDDNKPIEVNCHFCNEHYIFTVEELKEIYSKASR